MHKLFFSLVLVGLSSAAFAGEEETNRAEPHRNVRRMARNFGCCLQGYDIATMPIGVEQLGLSEDETVRIKQRRERFEKESKFAQKRSLYWRLDGQEYFERGFVGEKEFAQAFNERMLSEIEEVLGSRNRKTRFRELLTQDLLKWLDFEAIARLHDIELDWEKYAHVEKQVREARRSGTDPRFRHAAILDDLEDDGHLTRAELELACGELAGEMVAVRSRSLRRAKIDRDFIQAPVRLIRSSRLHRELELTTSQVSKANDLGRQLSSDLRKNRTTIEDAGKKAFYVASQRQREECEKRISELLTEQQYQRFRQLLFQFHTQRMQLGWALYTAGKPFDYELLPERGTNDVASASSYAWQVNQKLAGLKILTELVGQAEANRMCGTLVLTPSVAHAFTPESDQQIRDRMTKLMLKRVPREEQTNPRRASN